MCQGWCRATALLPEELLWPQNMMLADVTSNAESKEERRKEGTDSTENTRQDQHSITFNLHFAD